MDRYDFLIVGAGFAGAVMAERLARKAGKRVLVIDKRNHIGGNSYDYKDNHGVLLHRYGPHYFRTNSTKVRDYLSQFTQWHPVDYKVLSWTHQKYWSFPINLITFEQFLGRESSTEEMIQVLAEWKVPFANPANSEEAILSKMGRPFYDLFLKPWWSGLFLESALATSAAYFQFVFRMLAAGDVTLPRSGMQAIPDQLARKLPSESIRLSTRVTNINANEVTLDSGEVIASAAVVLATDCSDPDNQLNTPLRAQIISISLFVGKHSSAVMRGDEDFQTLIDINRSIMQGLAPPATQAA